MPLPTPFYLRTTQTTALTHAELDGNFTILNTKIDNTTCGNVGTGIGVFRDKEVGSNNGVMNLYSLSGSNGITIGVTGDTIVIDASNVTSSGFWEEFGTSNGALKDVKGTYDTTGTSTNSLIAGGDQHIVHDSISSFVGGGQANFLVSATTATIIGGKKNTIRNNFNRNGTFNGIVSGHHNQINDGIGCSILGGSGNTNTSLYNTVMGTGNIVSGQTSLVFGGLNKTGYGGNTVIGKANFVGGSMDNVDSDFNYILGVDNFSRANRVYVLGSQNEVNSGGTKNSDFVCSFVGGLNNYLIQDTHQATVFGQQNTVGGHDDGETAYISTNVFMVGLENTITGKTRQSSILAGENNKLGDQVGTEVSNCAILAGANQSIGKGAAEIIKNSSILAGQKLTGFTNDTAYSSKLQVTNKVRVSSNDYITTNSIQESDSPTIHNVVHDTADMLAIPQKEGGGEIVRYGLCAADDPTYLAGQFVYLDTDGCWKQTNVLTSGFTEGKMVGFALSDTPQVAGRGKGILIRGHLKLNSLPSGALPGEPLYLDASTPGTVTKTPPASSGNIVRAVGHLIGGPTVTPSGGYMFLNPDITYLQVS